MNTFALGPVDISEEPLIFYLLRMSLLLALGEKNVHRFVWVCASELEQQRAALDLGMDVQQLGKIVSVIFPDAPNFNFIASYIPLSLSTVASRILAWANSDSKSVFSTNSTQFLVEVEDRRIFVTIRPFKPDDADMTFDIEPYEPLAAGLFARIFLKLKTVDGEFAYFYRR